MPPREARNHAQDVSIPPHEWVNLMDVIKNITQETQKNHDDILVLKTKIAMAGIISGLISTIITSVLAAFIIYTMGLNK